MHEFKTTRSQQTGDRLLHRLPESWFESETGRINCLCMQSHSPRKNRIRKHYNFFILLHRKNYKNTIIIYLKLKEIVLYHMLAKQRHADLGPML